MILNTGRPKKNKTVTNFDLPVQKNVHWLLPYHIFCDNINDHRYGQYISTAVN